MNLISNYSHVKQCKLLAASALLNRTIIHDKLCEYRFVLEMREVMQYVQ